MAFLRKRKIIEVRLQSQHTVYREGFFSRIAHSVLWVPYLAGLGVITLVGGVFYAVSLLCHAVGLAVLWPPRTIARTVIRVWRWFLRDVEQTLSHAPETVRHVSQPQFAYGLLLFCLLAGGVFGLLKTGNLLAEGFGIKGRVLGQANLALSKISQGKDKLAAENLEEAQSRFLTAMNEFRSGSQALEQGNILLRTVIGALPAGKDAQNLLRAGELGSRGAAEMATVLKDLKTLSVSESGIRTSGKNVADIVSEFVAAKQSVAEAVAVLLLVNPAHVPEGQREQFVRVRDQLSSLQQGLSVVERSLNILAVLTTGDKHVLVLLQNSNELRPTGGFLGTFGSFDLKDGAVQTRTISSIYDLDGQLRSRYIPPLPLFAVNNRWYLRDSNWFASFPESAETIIGFYEEESHKTPDAVIALTPQVAIGLLALTGPIPMPAYGVTLDADNFIETTQVETSLDYDKVENKPKKMLADFFPALLEKVSNIPPARLPELLSVFERSLASKDLLLYARDAEVQQNIAALGFDGSLATTTRDYLAIISANLGGTKTDLAMRQEVNFTSTVESDGSVVNTLTIQRANPLPRMAGLENKVFMRVYVPLGSKLLSSKGFTHVDLDAKYGSAGAIHPKVAEWERAAVKAVDSGMLVGEESGKTFFGNWVHLEGGQRQTLELVYRLPYKMELLDRQSLVVQKQPGAVSYPLTYTLHFPGRALLWSTEQVVVSSSLTKKFDVDHDRYFGAVLEARN